NEPRDRDDRPAPFAELSLRQRRSVTPSRSRQQPAAEEALPGTPPEVRDVVADHRTGRTRDEHEPEHELAAGGEGGSGDHRRLARDDGEHGVERRDKEDERVHPIGGRDEVDDRLEHRSIVGEAVARGNGPLTAFVLLGRPIPLGLESLPHGGGGTSFLPWPYNPPRDPEAR